VLKLLNMLEFCLITVIYKRKSKFWYLTHSELNSCKDIFIKNLQGVPLHLHTYSCKYEKFTYLVSFLGADIT
jgi:hypothetical protein